MAKATSTKPKGIVLSEREKKMQAAMSKAIRELKKEAQAKGRKLVVANEKI